jgi:hypothetical protein
MRSPLRTSVSNGVMDDRNTIRRRLHHDSSVAGIRAFDCQTAMIMQVIAIIFLQRPETGGSWAKTAIYGCTT